MNTRTAANDLPYRLLGAALLLGAVLHAVAPAARPAPDMTLAQAAPGFTVAAPHVGQVRVIPLANAALISPCAAQDLTLPAAQQTVAEL